MSRVKSQKSVRADEQSFPIARGRGITERWIRRYPIASAAAVAAAGMLSAGHAAAQTPVNGVYVDNNGSTFLGNWSSAANWQGGIIPGNTPGNTAIFQGAATGRQTILLDVPVTLGAITFTSSGTGDNNAPWTLVDGGGGPLVFDNNGAGATYTYAANSTGFQDAIIGTDVSLNDNLTIFNGQTKHWLYLLGNISNTTNATTINIKSGSYIVSLNTTNANDAGVASSFAGSWVIGSGASSTNTTILRVGDDSNFGAGTSSVTFQGSSVQLRYAVGGATNNVVNTATGRQFFLNATTNTFDVAGGMNLNFNATNSLVGSNGVTFQNNGTTNINATQSALTGTWHVNGGTLNMNAPFSGAMTVSGATLGLNSTGNSFSSLTFTNAVLGYGVSGAMGGQAVTTAPGGLLGVALNALPGGGDSITVTPNTSLILNGNVGNIDLTSGTNNVTVQSGAIVAETQGGVISSSVTGVPQGVWFGVVGNVTESNLAIGGTGSLFKGISATPMADGSLSGSINAGGDFSLQGGVGGAANRLLHLGTTGSTSDLAIGSAAAGAPVNLTIAQGIVQSDSSGNDFSGVNNIYVGDGTNAAFLRTGDVDGAFHGLQGQIIVNNQGTLDPGSIGTTYGGINVPAHMLAGSQLLVWDAGNLNGTGVITFDPGSAISIHNDALGSEQLVMPNNGAGIIIRLGTNAFANEQQLVGANPAATFVITGGGNATNVSSFTLNGGTLANDTTNRTFNLASGTPINVGSNGASIAAGGATFTITPSVQAAGQALTVGTVGVIDAAAGGANVDGGGKVLFNGAVNAGSLNVVNGFAQFGASSSLNVAGDVNVLQHTQYSNADAIEFDNGNVLIGGGTGTINAQTPTGSGIFSDIRFVGPNNTNGAALTTMLSNGTSIGNVILGDNVKLNLTINGASATNFASGRLPINQKFTLQGQPAVGNNYNKIYVNSYSGSTNARIDLNNVYMENGSVLAVDRANNADVRVSPHLLGDVTAYSAYYSGAGNVALANFDFTNITSADGQPHTLTVAPGPMITLTNTNGVSTPLTAGIFGTVDNLSTVNVTAGTVTLQSGATLNGSLVANGGNVVVNAATTANTGSISHLGGTLALNADQSLANFTVGGATTPVNFTLTNRSVNATNVNVGAAGTLTVDAGGVLTANALNGAGTLNVLDGNKVTLAQNAASVTHTIGTLNLNSSGTLDLGNGKLVTQTPAATVRQYLVSAYAGNNWTGAGINSSFVSSNNSGQVKKFALGYAAAGEKNIVPAIPAGSVLVRPTLFGDTNLDGKVDNADISAIIAGGKYLDGTTNNSWAVGDWNYDGKVDNNDISNLIASGNYLSGQTVNGASAPAAHATAKLTSASATPAVTTVGVSGDGVPDYQYDPATGDVKFRTDGQTGVQEVHLRSASSQLQPQNMTDGGVGLNGLDVTTPAEIDLFRQGSSGGTLRQFADGYDFNNILPAGLSLASLLQDLTLSYTTNGGGTSNVPATLIYSGAATPEPTSLALFGVAAAGLLSRRRRRS